MFYTLTKTLLHMEQNPNLIATDLHIDGISELHLKETARWARFLGIVGFVVSVLFGVFAFIFPLILAQSMRSNPYGNSSATIAGTMSGMLTVVYLLFAILMFVISWFVYKFGTSTRKALFNNDQHSLNDGLLNLKRVFRIQGVLTVIYLGLLFLGLVIMGVSML